MPEIDETAPITAAQGVEIDTRSQRQIYIAQKDKPENQGLTDRQLEFATFVEQTFRLKSVLPSYADCKSAGILRDRVQYEEWFKHSSIRAYLKNNGLDLNRINGEVVSPLQLLVINTILDGNDKRPDHKKLKDCGVTTKQYAAWKSDPFFRSYFSSRVDNLIGNDIAEVDRALYDRAVEGDITAIKFLYEYSGKYRPISGTAAIDIAVLLVKLNEILTSELAGYPELSKKIGARLEALANESHVIVRLPGERYSTKEEPLILEATPVGTDNAIGD